MIIKVYLIYYTYFYNVIALRMIIKYKINKLLNPNPIV